MLASSLKRTMTAVFVSAALAGCNDGSSNDGSSSVEIVDKKNTAIMANRQFLGESVNIIDDHFSTQDLQLSIREKGVEVPKPKSMNSYCLMV